MPGPGDLSGPARGVGLGPEEWAGADRAEWVRTRAAARAQRARGAAGDEGQVTAGRQALPASCVGSARDRRQDPDLVMLAHRGGRIGRFTVHPHRAARQDRGEIVAVSSNGNIEHLGDRFPRDKIAGGSGRGAGSGEEPENSHDGCRCYRWSRSDPQPPGRDPLPHVEHVRWTGTVIDP